MPDGSEAPDEFKGVAGERPRDQFVICRDREGNVISRYSDDVWDLTAYSTNRHPAKLYFRWPKMVESKGTSDVLREMKWLMFLVMWRRPGITMAVGTLQGYIDLLRSIAAHATAHSLNFRQVLEDRASLQSYLAETTQRKFPALAALLGLLAELGEEQTGYEGLGGAAIDSVRRRSREYRQEYRQHPPIPTRIYSNLIAGLLEELRDFAKVSIPYLDLVEACLNDPLHGRAIPHQYKVAGRCGRRLTKGELRPVLDDLIEELGLSSYFEARALRKDMKSLMRGVTLAQLTCKLVIHCFSGMRDGEVEPLGANCLSATVTDGRQNYLIRGHTSKLNMGLRLETHWVTSKEGAEAVELAARIAERIWRAANLSEQPLFPSTAYLSQGNFSPELARTGSLELKCFPDLLQRLVGVITEADLRELEAIDPHRAWRSEADFQVGQPWRLTTHQFRRSLAIYASTSGLVCLPSLKRQLQHVTEEMSRYYARGSQSVQTLFGDDPQHFSREYQESQPQSQALAFLRECIFSGEQLFGGYGAFLEGSTLRRSDDVVAVRQETLRRFERREVAYVDTMLGGCTTAGPCKERAIASMVACISCKSAVIKMSKLDRVIDAQQKLTARLDRKSLEWRTESDDLRELKAARTRFLKKSIPSAEQTSRGTD